MQNMKPVRKQGTKGYPILVDDVDDDDELSVFLAIVDQSDPSDLHVPLEHLYKNKKKHKTENSDSFSK